MSKEENIDTKFVRALFGFLSWLLIVIPFLWGLYVHNWWLMLGVFLGAIGTALKIAIRDTDKPL